MVKNSSSEKTVIDPVTDLFRTDWPGVTTGPIVSQFILSNFEIDSIAVEPKAKPLFPEKDYMTSFQAWLDVQVRTFTNGSFSLLAVPRRPLRRDMEMTYFSSALSSVHS